MNDANRLLLAYYGDDFTGSTDVMESLAKAGVPTALFLEPPDPTRLVGRFGALQAIGVAGTSRSMTPEQMEAALPPIFEHLNHLNPEIFHYKTCSTFDSSAEVGSIGRATDIGQRVFQSRYVPLVVGAPVLKRYCLFGNLFATVGDETHRLDRHPTMRRHPVTPMDEADLRLHLGRQTTKRIGLLDILHLAEPSLNIANRLEQMLGSGVELVLFDVLDEPRLAEVGRLIWSERGDRPQFAVGSSGLEYALTAHWRANGHLGDPVSFPSPGAVDQLVVVSGSCSPTTAEQIAWALANGFEQIAADARELVDLERAEAARKVLLGRALEVLAQGRSVILDTAQGPHDQRVNEALDHWKRLGIAPQVMRERLGTQLGLLLRDVLERTGIRRAVVAGGDTSGQAARQLEIYALEIVIPTAPGSPLCRAASNRAKLDGIEIVLKGGQVGPPDYFGRIQRGES